MTNPTSDTPPGSDPSLLVTRASLRAAMSDGVPLTDETDADRLWDALRCRCGQPGEAACPVDHVEGPTAARVASGPRGDDGPIAPGASHGLRGQTGVPRGDGKPEGDPPDLTAPTAAEVDARHLRAWDRLREAIGAHPCEGTESALARQLDGGRAAVERFDPRTEVAAAYETLRAALTEACDLAESLAEDAREYGSPPTETIARLRAVAVNAIPGRGAGAVACSSCRRLGCAEADGWDCKAAQVAARGPAPQSEVERWKEKYRAARAEAVGVPTVGREWHEQVTRCGSCPFSEPRGMDGEEFVCNAHGTRTESARRITDGERLADAPPEWCPLRAGPRIVKLATRSPMPEGGR